MRGTFIRIILAFTIFNATAVAWLASTGEEAFSAHAIENGSLTVVTVNELKVTGKFLPNFMGFSYEASQSASGFNTSGNLIPLLKILGPGVIRIGGNSVDRKVSWGTKASWAQAVLTSASISQLAALARATQWKVELAVNLGHLDTTSITQEAQAAYKFLGPYLQALECGNEPNDYSRTESKLPPLRQASYGVTQYLSDFTTCANAIEQAGHISMAGPDTTGTFISDFIQNEHSRVGLITQHAYALDLCSSHPGPMTVPALLSGSTDQSEMSKISSTMQAAAPDHLSVRLDETNSANCGGVYNVSNVYASALWAVDYMLLMAQDGIAGVNFHGTLGQCGTAPSGGEINYYTPICATSSQGNMFVPQPLYYGMLLVGMIKPGLFVPVTVSTSRNISTYAIFGEDHKFHIIIVEKDDPSNGLVNVTLKAGNATGVAQVLNLTGTSLTSNEGIAIQGAVVTPQGSFRPGLPTQIQGRSGVYTIPLKSGSVALITLP